MDEKWLKKLNPTIVDLLDKYVKIVRSIMETVYTVWHLSVANAYSRAMEHVIKSALAKILGGNYYSYISALYILDLYSVEKRKSSPCLKFALKSASHPVYSK